MEYESYDQGGMMYDGGDYPMDAEYALEDNGLHMTAFGAQDNPKAQDKYTLTRGWEKFAFPKAVRLLRDADLAIQQKALLTVSELLSTGEVREAGERGAGRGETTRGVPRRAFHSRNHHLC